MKNWFTNNRGELPSFVHNRRLRRIMMFISLIVIYGIVISFLYNIVASLILIVISVVGLIFTIVMMNEMFRYQPLYYRLVIQNSSWGTGIAARNADRRHDLK